MKEFYLLLVGFFIACFAIIGIPILAQENTEPLPIEEAIAELPHSLLPIRAKDLAQRYQLTNEQAQNVNYQNQTLELLQNISNTLRTIEQNTR